MNRFDSISKDAMAKVEEIMNATRLNELVHKREEEEKQRKWVLGLLAAVGCIALVAGIAYAVYRFVSPDYLEDFEDDFDDDYDFDEADEDSCCCGHCGHEEEDVQIEKTEKPEED